MNGFKIESQTNSFIVILIKRRMLSINSNYMTINQNIWKTKQLTFNVWCVYNTFRTFLKNWYYLIAPSNLGLVYCNKKGTVLCIVFLTLNASLAQQLTIPVNVFFLRTLSHIKCFFIGIDIDPPLLIFRIRKWFWALDATFLAFLYYCHLHCSVSHFLFPNLSVLSITALENP